MSVRIMMIVVFILTLLVTASAIGGVNPAESSRNFDFSKTAHTFAKKELQGFDMRVWLSNQMTMGLQAWDANDGRNLNPPYGLEYPTGSGIDHLYGAGPWIGGIINGKRHVTEGYNGNSATKYFVPDVNDVFWRTSTRNIDEPNKRGFDDDNDGLLDEDDLDGKDNDGDWDPLLDDIGSDGVQDQNEVGCLGPYDATSNPDPAQDNYSTTEFNQCLASRPRKSVKAIYTERNGQSDHGEPNVDEDYAAISDKDLYCSANDYFSQTDHFPMGVKVIQKSYAWSGSFAEGILPFDFYFVNVGHNIIRDVYVAFFADMDVGPVSSGTPASRNYSCYIDTIRTAYIHNPIDRGSTPLGITVLGTPLPLDQLRYVFQWFDFSTNQIPDQSDSTLYSWISGEANAPVYIKECQPPTVPSDTRFFFSFGQDPSVTENSKFKEFRPGDTIKISVALVSGESVSGTPNNLIENAQDALKLFKRGYYGPVIPDPPALRLREGQKRVTLEWGPKVGPPDPFATWDDSNRIAQGYGGWRTENPPCGFGHICIPTDSGMYLPGGRTFEGYRLYRSEDPGNTPQATSFTLLKQFDLGNDDQEFNVPWETEEFADKSDPNPQRWIQTKYVDSNLVRGKRYWYAVTSFSVPDIAIVERPAPGGGVILDTLYTEPAESGFDTLNMKSIDLPFAASDRPDEVLVVPNPYRVDENYTFENGGWEGRQEFWDETKRLIRFIHLPRKCTIRVFTLTGDLVTTLEYQAPPELPDKGELTWNLLSESNRALASGVYIYTVESDFGRQIGKFVLIR